MVVLFIDEFQYVEEDELAALIAALHRCAQSQLPVTLIGAGLPQLVGQMGKAKSYAERLFEFRVIGPLESIDARQAIIAPAERCDINFNDDAGEEILRQTDRYPYFLQEWGKHSWNMATQSPVQLGDVVAATDRALAELDASFFRVRLDRLTPAEKRQRPLVPSLPGELEPAGGSPRATGAARHRRQECRNGPQEPRRQLDIPT